MGRVTECGKATGTRLASRNRNCNFPGLMVKYLLNQKQLQRIFIMDYSLMTEADIARIAALYMDYYNNCEDGYRTQEKHGGGYIRWLRSRIPAVRSSGIMTGM